MRYVLLLLCLCLAHPALAEPTLCHGNDLAAKMQAEDPKTYADAEAEARAIPNGEAIFWKIEKQGIEPSYLLGSAHVTDPRVTDMPPGAEEKLASASVVALELAELVDKQKMAAAIFGNAILMVQPPGQSLWDMIPDQDEALIRDNPNLPPHAGGSLYGYQPWVVAAMLAVPLCETQRKADGLLVLDEKIGAAAAANHIQVVGLETVTEQLTVLASMAKEDQVKYLIATAKLGAKASDYLETMISLYMQRRITLYMPFAEHAQAMTEDDRKIMAYVDEELIRKRNHRMAERAGPLIDKGNAFIAVGALHLPGKEGLVALLRQAGYKVTPLN
ncbi:TraB/GumN family protein [Aestuariivirga sp.]|uniref:TraB/GumN family protein n=1 Tax=Aestuariivirga sp. TaxID=2650926 RepID=UPI0039E5448A